MQVPLSLGSLMVLYSNPLIGDSQLPTECIAPTLRVKLTDRDYPVQTVRIKEILREVSFCKGNRGF